MKKKLVIALGSTLAVATAVPALALTNEVTGFLRVRGIMADLSMKKDKAPDKLVDQRFRAKWTMGVNEYVKVVYFGEIDFQYGDRSYLPKNSPNSKGQIDAYAGSSRNQGGGIGGDTVNLETKNLYMEVKIPNTPVTATVGLQGYSDNTDNVLLLADMAGIKVAGKAGPVDFNAAWFKLIEGEDNRDNATPESSRAEDDVTLYAVQGSMKPQEALKVGADLYYVNNQGTSYNQTGTSFNTGSKNKESLYYLALNGSYKLPVATLSGWLLYNGGTRDNSGVNSSGKAVDQDVSAFALSAKADLAPAPGTTAGVRLMYFSNDSKVADKNRKSFVQPFAGTAPEFLPFAKDGLMIMTANADQATYPTVTRNAAGLAMADAAYAGYGLFGGIVNGTYTPPAMKKLSVKGALGYFMALDDSVAKGSKREGTNLGGEIAVKVAYQLVDNLDVSLQGAYAMLGDFYDKSATGKKDPSDPYMLVWQANVSF